jgi:hypothetical protein
MMSGSCAATACLQNEWLNGVSRLDCHGSESPTALLKNCRSASTIDTRATGVFEDSSREASVAIERLFCGSVQEP